MKKTRRGFNSTIARKSRLAPFNRKRKAKLALRNFGTPAYREWTKRQPCAFCGEAPRKWWMRESWGNDIAHVQSRGAGGDWRKTVPACPSCHDAGKPNGAYALANEHMRRWAVECDTKGGTP